MNKNILALLIGVFFLTGFVSAIPQTFSVHGKLTDDGDYPLEGNYNMTFKIYSDYSGGSAIWSSVDQNITTDSDGVYNVVLTSIDLDFSEQYYLGIAVNVDGEMTPRINLTSSPYAFRAKNVSVSGVEFDSNVDFGVHNVVVGSDALFIDATSGRVGVGTASPQKTFHVIGQTRFQQEADNTGGYVQWVDESAVLRGDIGVGESIGLEANSFSIRAQGNLILASGGSNERMQIDSTGKVGIGTALPQRALHVNGDILSNSTINATGDICLEGGMCLSQAGSGSGDITSVVAGNGLTGGATVGDATLNIGVGNGISVAADSIYLGSLTANWDAGGYEIRSGTLESDVATGTAPLTIASTTAVSNLNADLLDGQHSTTFYNASNPFGFYNSTTLGAVETDPKWTGNWTSRTGSGNLVFATSPAFTTPNLGVATATTIDTGSGAKDLGDAAVANGDTNSIPTGDQVYDFVIGLGYGTGSGDGTVTSVAMTVPTGLTIAGTPITTSGTLALGFTSGYSIPTTTKQGEWDTAYTHVTTDVIETAANVQAVSVGGSDVTGTIGAMAVVDDSHNHVYSNIDATTSANWATRISDESGTGVVAFTTSPSFTTPSLGVASATTINTGSGAMDLGDAAVANGDTNSIPTGDQVYDFVIGLGYGTGSGDITSVVAGNGLTGGATVGDATLNIGVGNGISVAADSIYLGSLTANWDAGGYEIRSRTLESDVATGTAPLTIASTTKVTNLNADKLDSQEGSYYLNTGTGFGGDVSGAYNSIVVADDSHNHVYSNIDATTSANWATRISDESGTGVVAFTTSPAFTTPNLGVATATTIDTGSGAKELGDAAVANGDTNSIPTGDQVYDFVIGQGYSTSSGDITSVGSMTTGDAFAGAAADNDWLGLGATAGRIEFDDQAIDEVNIIAANVGIGTSTPEFKLSLDGDGGIIAKGTYNSGASLTTSGAGTRMIWYPKKAAFRAGYVSSTQWDDANIGDYSVAMGYNTTANNTGSVAMGYSATALGFYSTAMGNSVSSNTGSTAMGYKTHATEAGATAMGYESIASGGYSTAMGGTSLATSTGSTAMGYNAHASGYGATAMGDRTYATGSGSTAMGYKTYATGSDSTAMGKYSTASGDNSTAMGGGTLANNTYSTAIGKDTTASGGYSTAMGSATTASGSGSTSMGIFAKASNTAATAMGYYATASGYMSTAMGREIEAGADYVVAIGLADMNGQVCSQANSMCIMGGKVGIGTATPGSNLAVKSSIANDVLLLEDDSGACEAQPTTTGLTWSCSSDIKFKKNVRNATPIMDYIMGIPLFDYTVRKTDEDAQGPIAQDIMKKYPELVSEASDGSLRVSSLDSWKFVKAIQEQQGMINQLYKDVNRLGNAKGIKLNETEPIGLTNVTSPNIYVENGSVIIKLG